MQGKADYKRKYSTSEQAKSSRDDDDSGKVQCTTLTNKCTDLESSFSTIFGEVKEAKKITKALVKKKDLKEMIAENFLT